MKHVFQAGLIIFVALVSAVSIIFFAHSRSDRARRQFDHERVSEELRGQLAEARQRLETSEKTVRDLNDTLRKEKSSAGERLRSLYAANRALVKKNADLRSQRGREMSDLNKRLGRIMGQNEKLRRQLLTAGNRMQGAGVEAGRADSMREASARLDNTELKREHMDEFSQELKVFGTKIEELFEKDMPAMAKTLDSTPAIQKLAQLKPEAQQTVRELDAQIENLEGLLAGIEESEVKKLNDLKEERRRTEELKKQCLDSAAEIRVYAQEVTDLRKTIGEHRAELSSRDGRILQLEGKLREAERSVVQAQARTREMEQESSVLREKCVEAQLGRESLIVELNQARIKLAEFQQRLNQLGRPAEPAVTRADGGGVYAPARKVDVQILEPEP